MGTRSTIAIKAGNTVESMYCHYDGNPSHNGALLLERFNTKEGAQSVVDCGYLSSLSGDLEGDKRSSVHTIDPILETVEELAFRASVSDWEYLYVFDVDQERWFFCEVLYNEDYSKRLGKFKALTAADYR